MSAVEIAHSIGRDPKWVRSKLRSWKTAGHPLLQGHVHGGEWWFNAADASAVIAQLSNRNPIPRITTTQPVRALAPHPSSVPHKTAPSGYVGADQTVRLLLSAPLVPATPRDARRELPATTGVYAWWAAAGTFIDFRYGDSGPVRHDDGRFELIYIGIAGKRSSVSVADRVVGDHLGNQTGSSTLRRALGAWIGEQQGWQRRLTDRVTHTPDSERAITDWMGEHLRVGGIPHDHPARIESEVIQRLAPPLNVEGNRAAPNFAELIRRRERWRSFGG